MSADYPARTIRMEMSEEMPASRSMSEKGMSKGAPLCASEHSTRFDSMLFERGKSGVLGATLNYLNVIAGSGVLGMPYALSNTGLWLGVILLVLTGIYSGLTNKWLIYIGLKRHIFNYEDLNRAVLGQVGAYLYCLYTFFLAFTCCVAYVMITGDSLRDVSAGFGATGVVADRKFYLTLCSIFLVLPLSCLRDMHCLRYTSTISVIIFLSIAALVVFYSKQYSLDPNSGITPFRDEKKERLGFFIGPDVLAGLPTFFLAFAAQQACFEVFTSMKTPSYSNWKTVTNWSNFLFWAFTTSMCVSAWLNLGDAIEGSILETFRPNDTPTLVGKIMLAITMILTYPMQMFVARHVVNQGIFVYLLGKEEYMSTRRFFSLTFSIWAATFVIGYHFTDLTFVFGLSGALGGSFVGFITPALMYLVCFLPEMKAAFKSSKLWGLKWAALPASCLLFGLVALTAGTVAVFMDAFH